MLAFGSTFALVLVYALRGGSYDIVVFEEQGLVIWFTLALAIALGLAPRRRPSVTALVFFGGLAAYAAWTLASLMWTQSSELTTEEFVRSLDYLGIAALIISLLDRHTWRAAAVGLGAGALLVCLLSVGSRLVPSLFPANRVASDFHTNRLSYPFGYWNAVAAWGAMSVAMALTWSAHDNSRARRALALGLVPVAGLMVYLAYSRAGVGGSALAVLAALALSRNRFTVLIHALVAGAGTGLAILAVRGQPQIVSSTGTRGAGLVIGALAFAAAFSALVAYLTRTLGVDQWRLPARVTRPLAVLGGVAVLVPAVGFGPHLMSRAWRSFKHQGNVGNATDPASRLNTLSSTRYLVWKASLKQFHVHPVGGTGAGTFEFTWNQHGTDFEFVRDTHNIWLENLSELGLPGLTLIVLVSAAALVLGLTVRIRARRRSTAGLSAAFLALFAVYLLHATVDWMWEVTAVTMFAVCAVAILSGRVQGGRMRFGWPLRAALAAAAAMACLIHLPAVLSTTDIRRSQTAVRAGEGAVALSWANDAVDAQPWSASAYEQRGLVLEAAGRLSDAAHNLRQAVSHEPTNFGHWLILSRIETERGDVGAAVRDYKRAQRLRPRGWVFAYAPTFQRP